MAIPPLGRFVHERGRVLVHVSARARCASASIRIAAVTASEGQMRTRFRGPRVDRHDSSVCTSHVPSHERRSQTRLFKGLFWSFVGKVGDFNRQRNLRGVSPGLGRRGFERSVTRGFRGPWRLPGRANEARTGLSHKHSAKQGRIRGIFGPLIAGLGRK